MSTFTEALRQMQAQAAQAVSAETWESRHPAVSGGMMRVVESSRPGQDIALVFGAPADPLGDFRVELMATAPELARACKALLEGREEGPLMAQDALRKAGLL